MDSATALAWALDQKHEVIAALNFQYGAKQNQREALSVKALTEYYAIPYHPIELGFMNTLFKSTLLQSGGAIPEGHYTEESMKSTVVPFRNGIMLSIAAGVAESIGAQGIILGNHYGDHATYPDCRRTFIEPMKAAIREGIQCHPVFTDDAVERIYHFTKGSPRTINLLCDRALLAGFAASKRSIDATIIQHCAREVMYFEHNL